MKRYIIIVITFTLISSFIGCESFLDQKPLSQIGENGFYQNDRELDAAMIGVYDALQLAVQREFALTEIRSDNTKTRLSEGYWADFESLNVDPTNDLIATYWGNFFKVIYKANNVITHLDAVEDPVLKAQLEGEAKFIRALGHFNLVRLFENIPYIDKVISPTEAPDIPQRPSSEVYDAIVQDLKDAIAVLPTRFGIKEGRATKGAAQTLLAKVYLTMNNYSDAVTVLEDVMSSNDYDLEANFYDVFYKEMNKEIIFAVQYLEDDPANSEDFSLEFTWAGVASGVNYPTDNIKNAFAGEKIRDSVSFTPDHVEIGKFITRSNDPELGGNDWIILRYSDVLLMYVEALLAGGDITSDAAALAAFNQVRSRAGMPTVSVISKEDLLNERRVEFAFENQRWFDLQRLGVLKPTLEAFAAEEGFSFDDKDLILPIPEQEINLSNVWKQNDGY